MRLWTLAAVLIAFTGPAGAGAFDNDQLMGKLFHVVPEDLPAPYAEPSPSQPSRTVPRQGRVPIVPEGFSISLFADNIPGPRRLLVIDRKTVLVSLQGRGEVVALVDTNGDGAADTVKSLVSGMAQPYGLARPTIGPYAGDILIADTRGIWHLSLTGPANLEPVTAAGVFGPPRGHVTRSLAIDPKTGDLYVGVGSMSNLAEDPPPKASIQRFVPDGSHQRTFASGMRNPTGIGFNPATGKLWSMVEERDGLGDRLVPDYFTEVDDGDFFGWPYAYTGGLPQPEFQGRTPSGMKPVKRPSLLFEAHSSAMDFVFLPDSWPKDWQGDAIAALRGSWNRGEPTGYKLVRIRFADGRPLGGYQNFVTGFWVAGDGPAEVWGRPSNLDLMPDGSLLVADDTGGTIWRITPPSP